VIAVATRSKRSTAAAEPAVPMVTVTWIRDAGPGTPGEHSCNVGGRQYSGRAGQQVQMPAADAEVLAAGGFVRQVAGEA